MPWSSLQNHHTQWHNVIMFSNVIKFYHLTVLETKKYNWSFLNKTERGVQVILLAILEVVKVSFSLSTLINKLIKGKIKYWLLIKSKKFD